MFQRYEYLDGLAVLNDSNGKYLINIDGQIKNNKGNDLPIERDEEGHKVVYCQSWDGERKYRVIDLVALQFKFLELPRKYLGKVRAFVIDGDKENTHAGNVGYRFTELLPSEEFAGFYYVPGIPGALINHSGEAITARTGKIRKYTISKPNLSKNIKGGYFLTAFYLRGIGNLGTSRHRMLCLTFKDYPNNVDKLTVNHINGIPGDDDLENLEWATRRENNLHAYINDLKSQHKRVLVRNVKTKEVTEFYSLAEAARVLGLDDGSFRLRITRSAFGKIFSDGTQVKLKDDERPWVEHEDIEKELYKAKLSLPIKARNCQTGEIRQFDSVGSCALALNLERSSIQYRLANGLSGPFGGFQFKVVADTSPWENFAPEELWESLKPTSFKVCARNLLTGESRIYDSVKKAQEDLNKFMLGVDLRRGKQPLLASGWQVKYESDTWEEIENFEEALYLLQEGVMCLCPDGKIIIGESCKQLGRHLGLNGQAILKAAKSRGRTSYHGYRFRLGVGSDPWPDITLSL